MHTGDRPAAGASSTPLDPFSVLDDLPLLQLLTPELRTVVRSSFVSLDLPFGSVIVRQGENADAVYVLAEGRARVITEDDHLEEIALATVEPGELIGQSALIDGGVRTATVRTSVPSRVLRLDGGLLRGLVRQHPEIGATLRLDVRRNQLDVLFRRFPSFAALRGAPLRRLLEGVEDIEVAAGDDVIVAGDPAGPMYVVREGRFRAHRDDRSLAFARHGEIFGEQSTITGSPRAATVTALTQGRLLAVPPALLTDLVERDPTFAREVKLLAERYAYQQRAQVPTGFDEELVPTSTSPDPAAAVTRDAASPAADRPAGRQRKIRRFKITHQVDAADCGAASLVMVARHHGARISLARARQVCNTSTGGSTLAGIVDGAKAIGLDARATKVSPSKIDELSLPAAIHWDRDHWVVLLDVSASHAVIADPARGRRRVTRERLMSSWSGYTATFAPTERLERQNLREQAAFLRPYVRELRPAIIMAIVISTVVSVMTLLLPIFTQRIVDGVLRDGNVDLLAGIVTGLGATTLVIATAGFIQGIVLTDLAYDFDKQSLSSLTRRLFSLPMSYFYARRVGDVQRRLEGLAEVREFVVSHAATFVTSVLKLAVSLVLLVAYDPLLSLVWASTIPLNLGMIRFAAHRIRPIADNLEEHAGRYASKQVEAIEAVETAKAMGAEGSLGQELVDDFAEMARRGIQLQQSSLRHGVVFDVIEFVGLGALLFVGALRVTTGDLTVGQFVAFNAIAALATSPIDYLVGVWDDIQDAAIILTRLQDIFVEEPETHAHAQPAPRLSGAIRLRDVTVQYGGPESPRILDGVDLEIHAGETLAIVGRSGSGKSTLLRCIAGLIAPAEGSIELDGLDLATLDLTSVRRQIGVVLQESFLFADTLTNNIAFGEDAPDPGSVRRAARLANAHAFISRLPLGYETLVGETGVQLSGGQRQRVSIARAVYRDPALILLDEATSSLDAESERAVQQNLGRILAGRTSIVIAHRLSTVRDADRIIVLDAGRIAELGTHDELMERHGLYFYLVSQQLDL